MFALPASCNVVGALKNPGLPAALAASMAIFFGCGNSLNGTVTVSTPLSKLARTLSAFSRTLQELARAVETEGPVRQLPSLEWGAEALREVKTFLTTTFKLNR